MRALMYTAPGKVEMRDIAEPRAGAGEVLARVSATGICGSDVHGFLGQSARRKPGLVLGHETVGVITAVGEGVDAKFVGARVSINPLMSCWKCENCASGRPNVCTNWRLLGLDQIHGAFAELVAVPVRNVTLLPAHVTDAQAVMIEPLANAVHLVGHTPAHAGNFLTAAIFGGGTLGVSILSAARARGIRVVAVVEPNALRAKVAEELGAGLVLDPRASDVLAEIQKITGGRGVDLGIDAVGLEITRQQSAACVARGGTAIFLGMDAGPSSFDFIDLIRREVRLQCTFTYTERDYADAVALVASGAVNFTRWTDVLPMSEGQGAFEKLVKNPGDRIKIALKP